MRIRTQHTSILLLLTTLLPITTTSLCQAMSLGKAASSSSKLVADFASRPYIQRALQDPNSVESVLTFMFGVDDNDSAMVQHDLEQGHCLTSMSPLWFGGGPDYDVLCQPFADTIRAAGRRTTDWPDTTDSLVAQLVCCDQLSRNVFRGTPEAFAYDETSLELAKELSSEFLRQQKEASSIAEGKVDTLQKIPGKLHPPYCAFVALALMHSESLEDHDTCCQVLDTALVKWQSLSHVHDYFEWTKQFELDHRVVIETFGRYPHRNKHKGRETLPEELVWLEDEVNLPAWAKSQG